MREIVATFSIAAFDPETESLGVAVQSKFLAVGALLGLIIGMSTI